MATDTLAPARRSRIARVVVVVAIASTGLELGAAGYALYWFLRQQRAASLSGESGVASSALELLSPIAQS